MFEWGVTIDQGTVVYETLFERPALGRCHRYTARRVRHISWSRGKFANLKPKTWLGFNIESWKRVVKVCLMITPKETQKEGSIANFDADHLLHLFTAPIAELALSIRLHGQITSSLQQNKSTQPQHY